MKLLFAFSVPFFLFLLSPLSCFSQEFQVWPTVSIEKSFSKKYTIELTYQSRVRERASAYHSSLISTAFSYKVLPYLKLGIDYRIRFAVTDQVPSNRFGISLTAFHNIRKVKISFRTAYQRRQTYFVPDDMSGSPSANFWRNRLEFTFDLPKKLSCNLGVEPYALFTINRINLDRIRFSAGLRYAYRKRHTFYIDYLFQPEFDDNIFDRLNHILRFGYSWDIPSWKKKKKGKNTD